MKSPDNFAGISISRAPLAFVLCLWMMMTQPAVTQTQNLPPPKNPDSGPQTNTDEGAGPAMRDRTKPQQQEDKQRHHAHHRDGGQDAAEQVA